MSHAALAGPFAAEIFEALLNDAEEGICVLRVFFDAQGEAADYEYVLANPAFLRITGFDDVRGRRLREVSPDQPDHWLPIIGEVARTGESVHLSDVSPRLGRWFYGHAFAVPAAGEHIVAVRFRDITEQRREHERLASVYRITTVGVMFWGEGFGLKNMNEGFLQMTGYTRQEALGKTWEELTPPEFHEISRKAVWEVSNLGETTPYEKQYFRKDGSRWWGLFAARRTRCWAAW